VREEDGRTVSVVWMYVTDFHVLQSVFVVVFLAILSLVLDIRPAKQVKIQLDMVEQVPK